MGAYLRPRGLEEALQALTRPFMVLAGGTDFYPARVGRPVTEDILDIGAIAALRGISETADGWRLGATTTWSELVEAGLPPLFDGLKQAAREVGGGRSRMPARSPAISATPRRPPMACRRCWRSMPRSSWRAATALAACRSAPSSLGNRRTALLPDELVTALHVPRPQARGAEARSSSSGARRYLVISIAMASVVDRGQRIEQVAARAYRRRRLLAGGATPAGPRSDAGRCAG